MERNSFAYVPSTYAQSAVFTDVIIRSSVVIINSVL
ncbi:hypothetical protein J2Z76_001495 [Sedimentibacter acidaminivorans]|uniref:Uncharacterized protein n=1 Tax=Sedimentibacter acidaminivorans TaxID=913099 RepID=A0ABS4GD75_9FIRM|nr:hypothetical protein [Sedimentibacter acidaminivorans]